MKDYLKHLAKAAGLRDDMSRLTPEGWQDDFASKDGRDLPSIAVLWQEDWKAWCAYFGALQSPEFAHPSDAFAWLRNFVAAYEFPPCPLCDDTGVIERSEDLFSSVTEHDTRDWTEPCDCDAGSKVAQAREDAEESLAEARESQDEMRRELREEALDRR